AARPCGFDSHPGHIRAAQPPRRAFSCPCGIMAGAPTGRASEPDMTHRFLAWYACIALALLGLLLALVVGPGWWWLAAVAGLLSLLGLYDVSQRTSTLRRLYPVLAYFRYALEGIGPEIRQYFI